MPEQTTPPTRPPTIRSVAARAGVSKSLVSLVLQGSPRVSEERRQAVLRAVEELGYRPDPAARSLAERRSRTVGVVLEDLRNPWFVELLDGVRPLLRENGLRPLLGDARTEPELLQTLADLRVDGILIVGTLPELAAGTAAETLTRYVPTVVAGAREPLLPGVDVVANDDEAGMGLAVRHLLDLGHRHVAHVAGSGLVGELRRRTCVAGIAAGGGTCAVEQADMTEEGGHRAGLRLLGAPDPPTAVLAVNDTSAIGILSAAAELRLRVPEDVSVVGYDNSSLARLRPLSLTSVDAAVEEVGRRAATHLLQRIGGEAGPARTELVPPSLVVRGSTAPPRAPGH
ncbi:DNA-binding LacI/PurR family transcriptional regulator [Kineococcus xinjiangensis]|uniref:DNA-binding LacI/PurR family transcriptional regulator n=1 Tax=Kineococcus xinjiangensis TaxID=512762 RepID=A0A2S6IEL7_9ACTN|nr:LacI family DNA-binding transcriptional regulator [Kineococcus xinjiangensis]PPK92600.1 DNA-binding LacI/PurR family transcriptional regulator [Kineococcus xinjiangensis]